MRMVNVSLGTDTNIAITKNSAQAQAGKLNSKGKTVKFDFTKLLGEKSSDVTGKELSIQDSLNQLMTLLANLETNISSKDQSNRTNVNLDNHGKLILKDSIDSNNKNLISLLSSLLNQLNDKTQSNDLTSKVNLTSTELDTNLFKQSQPLKETVNESKIVAQAKLPITSGNTLSFVKDIKEISNVIEQLLSSVKSEGTNTALKGNDIAKLEGILKNLVQVVDTAEKQVTLKNTIVDMQTLVKSQILLSSSSNNDTGKQNNDSQYTKANADADKILQRIANQDGSDKTQSFANLVTRASAQIDMSTTKVADNLVINKDSLTNDVIKTVKFMDINSIKDLTVKITPKDLGEVIIKVTQESGVMKASITTSNKEAFQLINSNLQDINNKISSNNMSIQSFSVDVFNGESSMFKQGTQQNKESKQGKSKNGSYLEEQDDMDVQSIGYKDNNVNILV